MVVSCQSVGAVSPGGLSVNKSGRKTETMTNWTLRQYGNENVRGTSKRAKNRDCCGGGQKKSRGGTSETGVGR